MSIQAMLEKDERIRELTERNTEHLEEIEGLWGVIADAFYLVALLRAKNERLQGAIADAVKAGKEICDGTAQDG